MPVANRDCPSMFNAAWTKCWGVLLADPRHPSLQIKKVKCHKNRWDGRVSLHCRVIFMIEKVMHTSCAESGRMIF